MNQISQGVCTHHGVEVVRNAVRQVNEAGTRVDRLRMPRVSAVHSEQMAGRLTATKSVKMVLLALAEMPSMATVQ